MKVNTSEGYVHLDIIWMKTNFLKFQKSSANANKKVSPLSPIIDLTKWNKTQKGG